MTEDKEGGVWMRELGGRSHCTGVQRNNAVLAAGGRLGANARGTKLHMPRQQPPTLLAAAPCRPCFLVVVCC